MLTPPHTPSSVDVASVASISPPPTTFTALDLKVKPSASPVSTSVNNKPKKRFDFANLAKSATEPEERENQPPMSCPLKSHQHLHHHHHHSHVGEGQEKKFGRRRRKKFICRFCQRQFTKSYNLLIHERTHTDERPFNCDICGKAFRRQDHLRDHRLVTVLGYSKDQTKKFKTFYILKIANKSFLCLFAYL